MTMNPNSHTTPQTPQEVCLQLRHFNQVIGRQCRNMQNQGFVCPCCLTDIAIGCDAAIKLCVQQLTQPRPQTPIFQQLRNALVDLRAEAKGVHRMDVMVRGCNAISWLLRELYFEAF
ncbi:hypothetical protein [Serratia marcescens]|uniref:hypothetical protein n=1 Tax=Serratia marcescens TaxID=615 RepID=UPI0009272734|nr:hypothetical protein [Serratia marcescens]OJH81829.1 hypothetical protein ASJ78_04774 [Serratia marcescens]